MTRRLTAALLISLVLMPLAVVSTATPATAANCATAGHSYVIDSSGFYQSGYEGDYRFGIQYLVLPAGTAFQVGGNGMLPDSFAEFNLYPGDTVPPWVRVQQLTRPEVGGNCVVNQRWVFPSATAWYPPGAGQLPRRAYRRLDQRNHRVHHLHLTGRRTVARRAPWHRATR